MLDDVQLREALRRIDDCERRGVPILGLEWFHRSPEGVVPAGVLDLSEAQPGTTWAEARQMLSEGIPEGANTVEVVTGRTRLRRRSETLAHGRGLAPGVS
jgi:hypothetical protein